MEHNTLILSVEMGNLLYPITHDILHQVCSPNGTIGRIMLIPCSKKKIAIIHQSSHKAMSARSSLNGRTIYDYCCHLEIQFSSEFWMGMYEKFIDNIVFNGTSAKTYLNEDLYEVDQQQYNVSQSNSEISMEHDDHDVLSTVPGAKPLELDLDDESESAVCTNDDDSFFFQCNNPFAALDSKLELELLEDNDYMFDSQGAMGVF
ncbi:hypothetical protein Nepgr_024833 [Nepenthes gracilis]|uniref:PTBP1-like RNA recognition motif 2 domain-containing protein n=1 Tax=Nepenthes gracilis TaxID=150966 RepID=A0AAD3T4S7_NEPGR|nr:hypothetical protein Nepgr_024833 [Nepenthes gracilis]